MKIPPYKTLAGQTLPTSSISENDLRFIVQSTNEEECRAYCEMLSDMGYECRSFREIPSADVFYGYKNLAYTFTGEDANIFIFWNAEKRTVYVTGEPRSPIPEDFQPEKPQPAICKATLTQCPVNFGMSYVIRLENSEFVIIDGGERNKKDEEFLFEFLKKNCVCGERPKVAMWIFTHPDEDHINLAASFMERYSAEVEIEAFCYQFPNTKKINATFDVAEGERNMARLSENIGKYYRESKVYTLHTGQLYTFPGVEIEVLWSIDDTYPSVYTSFNEVSAALRCRFKSGKTVMVLGDCMHKECKGIADTYGKYLKSDILQVAHHGLIGGSTLLYSLIDPEICLWSTSEERFMGTKPGQRYQWCLGEGGCDYNRWIRDPSVRERLHFHHGQKTEIDMENLGII